MDQVMQPLLYGGNEAGNWKVFRIALLAACVPIVLPVVHMLVFAYLWGKHPVDKSSCQCSCWDTVFKGAYENGYRVGYKHVYFNSNPTTLKMWIITVFFVIFLYEAFKHFFRLLLKSQVRWTMTILFLGSLHNQYYAWWGHWNFWNDDFYRMWNHQMFFTVTEGAAYFLVILSLDRSIEIQPVRMLAVSCIALFHIYASGVDQFFYNVVFGKGDLNKVLRDLLFMSSDLVFFGLSTYELRKYLVKRDMGMRQFILQRSNFIFLGWLVTIMFFSFNLLPIAG